MRILPCPCGGFPRESWDQIKAEPTVGRFTCPSCLMRSPGQLDRHDAITAWNVMAVAEEAVGALRLVLDDLKNKKYDYAPCGWTDIQVRVVLDKLKECE